ncbi:MAG: hypothetical protein V4516_02590 [Pseudomonadota bacterium]
MRLTILATILALSATVASAEDKATMDNMAQGLTMLTSSLEHVLKQFNLEADVMSLSLSQLAEIEGVLTDSNTDADKKAGIEAALRK